MMNHPERPYLSNMPHLDFSYLSTLPRSKQRQIIGQYLYPLICNVYPNFMPHKLTDILLDINSIGVLIGMIRNPEIFNAKLKEAVNVLVTYYAMSVPGNEGT